MARTIKREEKPKGEKDTCFVIMPFESYFDTYYKEIYCRAIKESGLQPTRADDFFRSSNIVNDIWELTKKAKVVLADLTTANPNVFYELGIAHAVTKPAIITSESLDFVPFDLRSLRVIIYDKNLPDWGERLTNSITKAIQETLKDPQKSIPPTFFETDGVSKQEIPVDRKQFLRLENEIASLRSEMQSLQAVRSIQHYPNRYNLSPATYPSVYNIPAGSVAANAASAVLEGLQAVHSASFPANEIAKGAAEIVGSYTQCPNCQTISAIPSDGNFKCPSCGKTSTLKKPSKG